MAFKKKEDGPIEIKTPNIVTMRVPIVGTAPYVQNKFSQKARAELRESQEAGKKKAGKKNHDARDFESEYEGAMHLSEEGWHGIPAPAFRAACIDACRLVGLEMTKAKMTVFVVPDGIDAEDGTPLVRITGGDPEPHEAYVRHAMTTSLRVRPMWRRWSAVLTLQVDADVISQAHVMNLLARAGTQVGVGEGRPFSKMSCGQGWGTFTIADGVTVEGPRNG